jgi:hypothetical protein
MFSSCLKGASEALALCWYMVIWVRVRVRVRVRRMLESCLHEVSAVVDLLGTVLHKCTTRVNVNNPLR